MASLRWTTTRWARVGLLVLALYLVLQLLLQQRASSMGETYARVQQLEQATSHALAQPLSPYNWLIIVTEGERYHLARVNLAATGDQQPDGAWGWLGRIWTAYRSPSALNWEQHSRFGVPGRERALVQSVWQAAGFDRFRRFAHYPVLYRVDRDAGGTCIWFTDLRYLLPELIPPFRYGMCGAGAIDHWKPYRLRRSTWMGASPWGSADNLVHLPVSVCCQPAITGR